MIFNSPKQKSGVPSSDHNLMYHDGIITWNMWAPGTRNGCQDVNIERKASAPFGQVAQIIKDRLDLNIQHIISTIKNLHSQGKPVDAICLQEVPGKPVERNYFLQMLNQQLVNSGLQQYCVNPNNFQQTQGESFGQLTLADTSRYNLQYFNPNKDLPPNQQNRVLGATLTPKYNDGKTSKREIWNIHGKMVGDTPQARHAAVEQDMKNILQITGARGATLAGDTNTNNIMQLGHPNNYLYASGEKHSFAAWHGTPESANLVAQGSQYGKPGGYVDAIITSNRAPHVVAAQQQYSQQQNWQPQQNWQQPQNPPQQNWQQPQNPPQQNWQQPQNPPQQNWQQPQNPQQQNPSRGSSIVHSFQEKLADKVFGALNKPPLPDAVKVPRNNPDLLNYTFKSVEEAQSFAKAIHEKGVTDRQGGVLKHRQELNGDIIVIVHKDNQSMADSACNLRQSLKTSFKR